MNYAVSSRELISFLYHFNELISGTKCDRHIYSSSTFVPVGVSAMKFYEGSPPFPSVDSLLGGNAVEAIRRVVKEPRARLTAWYIAGSAASESAINRAIRERGIRSIKIKISGADYREDAVRTAAIFRAATRASQNDTRIHLVADSNEANPNAQSVIDYLEHLKTIDSNAYDALEYLEQPTPRDIEAHAFDWSTVTGKKRVLVDEGLTEPRLFSVARDQGWSGFALKTCKGHSFSLVAAAWANLHGMCISLQDLTNPGYSAIHAALLGAHLPTINGVELNSWQFTPDANARWLPRLGSMIMPNYGSHEIKYANAIGLGSKL